LSRRHPAETGETLNVVVGLLEDPEGRVLINQRLPGKPLGGCWEFPGGKRRVSETPWEALCRELDEELGIEVLAAERFLELCHDYPERRVRLDVWRIGAYRGRPMPREGQPLAWVGPQELGHFDFLAADGPIVEALLRDARV
jgi:8-oxo-dGTP diphosphatase